MPGCLKRRMFQFFMTRGPPRRAGAARRPAGVAGRPAALCARRPADLRAAQEHAGHEPRARGLHRGRGGRAGDLQLLSRARRQHEAALRPDRGLGVRHHPSQRRGLSRHGRQAGVRGRAQDRRLGRGALPQPRRVQGVLQERRGDQRRQDGRRLGAYRRRRLSRRARAPAHHRPRQGRREAERRHAVRAEVHREQAEVLSRTSTRRWPSATAATTSPSSSTST